jgi:hypothetical protein
MAVMEHLPPINAELTKSESLIFLAGPIQGAPDWQADATTTLRQKWAATNLHHDLHIANPRREYLDGTFDWDMQVDWEELHLERSARNGAVLFWLAKQDFSLPYEIGRSYAQTTRFEYGDMTRRKMLIPSTQIVIGIEPGYVGSERYYRKRASRFSDMPVYDDLEMACDALVKVVERK